MLRPQQVRQLSILGFFFIFALALTGTYPALSKLLRSIYQETQQPPPPPVDDAPAPPPSPLPPGTSILHGALRDVKDLTPIAEVDQEEPYRKLLENVVLSTEEGLRQSAEGAPGNLVRYSTFVKYAPELRGRVFLVQGLAIQDSVLVRLSQPVRGREDVYRLFLTDLEGSGGFACDFIERPQENLERLDRIEFEGMFYKIARFKNTSGQERDVPLLAARTFRRLPPEPPAEMSLGYSLYIYILVLGILGILVAAWFLLRQMAARSDVPRPLLRRRPGPGGGLPGKPGGPAGPKPPPEASGGPPPAEKSPGPAN